MVTLRIPPRMFGQMALQNLTGNDPKLVTDAMIKKINEWLSQGARNKKDYFSTDDVESVCAFVMGRA
jgi:hypothetical protein